MKPLSWLRRDTRRLTLRLESVYRTAVGVTFKLVRDGREDMPREEVTIDDESAEALALGIQERLLAGSMGPVLPMSDAEESDSTQALEHRRVAPRRIALRVGGAVWLHVSSEDGATWNLLVLDPPGLEYPVKLSIAASDVAGRLTPIPRRVAAAIGVRYVRDHLAEIGELATKAFSPVGERMGRTWHRKVRGGEVQLSGMSYEGGYDIMILGWQPDDGITDGAGSQSVRFSARVTTLEGRPILVRRQTAKAIVAVFLDRLQWNPFPRPESDAPRS